MFTIQLTFGCDCTSRGINIEPTKLVAVDNGIANNTAFTSIHIICKYRDNRSSNISEFTDRCHVRYTDKGRRNVVCVSYSDSYDNSLAAFLNSVAIFGGNFKLERLGSFIVQVDYNQGTSDSVEGDGIAHVATENTV